MTLHFTLISLVQPRPIGADHSLRFIVDVRDVPRVGHLPTIFVALHFLMDHDLDVMPAQALNRLNAGQIVVQTIRWEAALAQLLALLRLDRLPVTLALRMHLRHRPFLAELHR